MAAAIGGMGAAMFQVGGQMWQVQAAKQFSEHRLDTTREANKLMAQIEANHDPEAIAEYTNQFYEYARNKEIPNGLAARRYQEWVNLSMPEIESAVAAKKRKITVDDWTAHGLELTAEAERTGNSSAIEAYYKDGVRAGMVDSDTAAGTIIKVKEAITYQNGLSWAWTDPEGLQAAITTKDGKLSIPGSGFTPEQVIALQANAKGAINFREQQQEKALSALYGKADEMASNNISPQDMKTWVRSQNIPPKEQTAVMKRYLTSLDVWNATGTNPYTTRLDNAKFKQMQEDAIDGKLSEKQIREEVGKTITIPDGDKLRDILNNKGTQTAFEDTQAAKYIEELVTTLSGVADKGQIPILREKGYRLLYNAIKMADLKGHPLTEREKKETALRIFNDLEKEAPVIPVEPSSIQVSTIPTKEEFAATVKMLRAHGWEAAAKIYYNNWIDVLWPK
jgi:hypothetical protein